jgi:hypothetical protein
MAAGLGTDNSSSAVDTSNTSGDDDASNDVASVSGPDFESVSDPDVASVSGSDLKCVSGSDVASVSGPDLKCVSGPDFVFSFDDDDDLDEDIERIEALYRSAWDQTFSKHRKQVCSTFP